MKTRAFDYGRYFENKTLKVKLYDAGRRINQMLTVEARKALQDDFSYQHEANWYGRAESDSVLA